MAHQVDESVAISTIILGRITVGTTRSETGHVDYEVVDSVSHIAVFVDHCYDKNVSNQSDHKNKATCSYLGNTSR